MRPYDELPPLPKGLPMQCVVEALDPYLKFQSFFTLLELMNSFGYTLSQIVIFSVFVFYRQAFRHLVRRYGFPVISFIFFSDNQSLFAYF